MRVGSGPRTIILFLSPTSARRMARTSNAASNALTTPRILAGAAIVALIVAVAPAATGQTPQPTEFTVTGHDEGGEFWFEVEGNEERNPEIVLAAGEEYTVTFENVGQQVHNLHFGGGIDEATELLQAGQSATLTFTAPDEIGEDAFYWCDPHRGLGMEGPLSVTAAAPGGNETNGNETDGEEAGNGTPGFGAVAALAAVAAVGLALASRRR